MKKGSKVIICGPSSYWGNVQIGSVGVVDIVTDREVFVFLKPKYNQEHGNISFPLTSLKEQEAFVLQQFNFNDSLEVCGVFETLDEAKGYVDTMTGCQNYWKRRHTILYCEGRSGDHRYGYEIHPTKMR